MAMALSRFSHWIWPGSRTRRTREPPPPSTAMANGLFPDSPSGFREPDAVGLPSSGGGVRPRKGKSRRHGGRGEARVDREHDMVIVPSDRDGGGGLSDSDSDGSDWSIGWLERHAPELQSDGDSEGSFAVLVPCYRRGRVQRAGRPHGGFPGSGGADDSRVSVPPLPAVSTPAPPRRSPGARPRVARSCPSPPLARSPPPGRPELPLPAARPEPAPGSPGAAPPRRSPGARRFLKTLPGLQPPLLVTGVGGSNHRRSALRNSNALCWLQLERTKLDSTEE